MYKSLTPIQTSRSQRSDRGRGVTTGKAGKILPLRMIPVLREDMPSGSVTVSAEMQETVRPIVNNVSMELQAWFVPFPAFQRFPGLDDYNRAYAKQPEPGTSTVKPLLTTANYASNPIYKTLGIHGLAGQVNNTYLEAYNTLVNYMYKDRSPNLTARTELDTSLAPCFWRANRYSHVVPNYDRSMIDGVVPISAPGNKLKVSGIGLLTGQIGAADTSMDSRMTGDANSVMGRALWANALDVAGSTTAGNARFVMEREPGGTNFPNIRVDLGAGANPVTISLANIDLARKQAAFDQLRKKFAGHDDQTIIKLMMEGIRVPDQMERQPWLLASKVVNFDFATRFATDGANLAKSVSNGLAGVSLSINMPRSNSGGVICIVASVVPDQLFERQWDNFLQTIDHETWPKYERDTLDLDKVDTVTNGMVDVSHATPAGTFGYEPMNARWQRDRTYIGGDLYRPSSATAWVEERACLWVTEPVNPQLTRDWYLATSINYDPFADKVNDHLIFTVSHDVQIEGNTVFGPPLLEVV